MHGRSLKDIHCAVVKNENESHDANVMAQLENQRSLQSVLEKQTKYQNFVNTTKLNASKIYKEQQSKKIDDSNAKKIMVQKQKELKAKYTVMERKKQQPRGIQVEPTKVDWKRVDPSAKGIRIPVQKIGMFEESQDEGSGIDSQLQQSNIRTPQQLMREREGLRNKMLNKWKGKQISK